MATIPVSEARARLPKLLDQVEAGAEIVLTRHGKEIAVLIRPDLVRVRRKSELSADAARLGSRIEQARHEPLGHGPGISAERAEEYIAEIRAGRDR